MIFFTALYQMIALLLIIAAGWIAARCHMLDEHTNASISKLIVNLFNPLLVLSSAAGGVGRISLHTLGIIAVIAAAMFLFFILVGAVLAPLFDRDPMQRSMFRLMFTFSNLGFIGIPVVSNILGTEYVVYVMVFMLVYNVIFYTHGLMLMEGRFPAASLRALVNPGTVCSLTGLLLIAAEIHLPDFVLTAVSCIGDATSPLALMAIGYLLAQSDLRQLLHDRRIALFALIDMLVLPLLMLPALRLFPLDATLRQVCAIMFGMPVGSMPLLLGLQKDIDCRACTAAILTTTVLCIVTVPLLLLAVH